MPVPRSRLAPSCRPSDHRALPGASTPSRCLRPPAAHRPPTADASSHNWLRATPAAVYDAAGPPIRFQGGTRVRYVGIRAARQRRGVRHGIGDCRALSIGSDPCSAGCGASRASGHRRTPRPSRSATSWIGCRREFESVRDTYGARLTALETEARAVAGGGAPAAAPLRPAEPTPATAPPARRCAGRTAATTPPAPTAQAGQPAPEVGVPPGAAGAGGPEGSLPVYGNASALSKIFNPDIAVIGNFTGAAGKNQVDQRPALEMGEVGSELPGDCRPVRPRRLLLCLHARERRSGGGLPHAHLAAGRPAGEGRQVPRADRQGQHAARARAAVGRRAAGADEPAGQRGRDCRFGHLACRSWC